MTKQSQALLRLLSDDDPETCALVKQQFTSAGLARIGELRDILPQATGAAARRIRETILEIEAAEADTIFAQRCESFGEHGDLEAAAWQLAAAFSPGDDFGRQRGFLDAWAAEISRRLTKADTEVERVETLVEYLGEEVGLRGNEEDYYNLNNSLLPEVIDTRMGIPITLSLVYLLVARRVGMEASGVGFPGHFFIRFGEHFFDPFHGGQRLSVEACRALAERQGFALRPEHFAHATPRQFLTRMLGNVVALARESDPALAAKVSGWIDTLHPGTEPT